MSELDIESMKLSLQSVQNAHCRPGDIVDHSVTGQELNLLSSYKFKYMLSAYVRGNAIKI